MKETDFISAARSFIAARQGREAVSIPSDIDLFSSGIVDSKFLMELILFVEDFTASVIDIDEFKLDRFRTLERIQQHYVDGRAP